MQCVLPSFGERYLSTPLFQQVWKASMDEERKSAMSWADQDPHDQVDGADGAPLVPP